MRHTLVIGGTRGTGLTFAKLQSQSENHTVSVIGRRTLTEKDQSKTLNSWSADLGNLEQIDLTLKEILKKNGPVTHVVFFQRFRGDGESWDGEIKTSLTATKFIIEKLSSHFDKSKEKSVVVVSSLASDFVATEQPLSYHVAKAGLNQIVRFFAVTLGPKGIRVNSVTPGTVLKEESKDFYTQNKALHSFYQKIIPLGRMGTSEEVSNAVEFLCSPKASFITGQNLVVDGGLSLYLQESLARDVSGLNTPKNGENNE